VRDRFVDKGNVKGKYNLLEGEEIRLTVLSDKGWSGAARIVQVNAQIAVFECATSVPPGAALRVDAGDALFFGECRRCEPDGDHFKFEIKLEQIIPSVSDLAKLMSAIRRATPQQSVQPDEHTATTRSVH
jgi:hypothetical protein